MNKVVKISSFLLVLLSSYYLEVEAASKYGNYPVAPIDRSLIHPSGDYMTTQVMSSNWSGYVAAQNLTGFSSNYTVSSVTGSWTVPTLIASPSNALTAIWVGIDGFLDGTVEQIGSSHYWANGVQHDYVWFEMYPNGAYWFPSFPIKKGDQITASVTYSGNYIFSLVITNRTKNVSAVVPIYLTMSSSALRSSAEWVVEAPYSGGVLPLSDFQQVTFTNCSAVIDGVTGPISNCYWQNDEIIMMKNGVVEALPSPLSSNGSGFNVTWKAK